MGWGKMRPSHMTELLHFITNSTPVLVAHALLASSVLPWSFEGTALCLALFLYH